LSGVRERRLVGEMSADSLATLDAIQNGSVDAVVVNGPNGPQIFSLESPEQPFRPSSRPRAKVP
jgi:hypothetical protein